MTSNYEPSTLYPEGLHRDRVLPAIELIQARMDVMNVDAGVDYRRRSLEQVQCYHTPLDERAQAALQKRSISWPTRRRRNRCCISSTVRSARSGWPARWCGSTSPRCAAAPLAERLPGAGQPLPRRDPVRRAAHGAAPASEARRFTWLIDVFYDHRVKLIMSAECEPEEIYTEGALANEFHRTVSRILEMQSREYLESERRLTVTL